MRANTVYPEKRDIRAIAVLLATQGLIRLGEIADPLQGKAVVDLEGARFFTDLLGELQRKTASNLPAADEAFLAEALDNLRQALARRSGARHG